MRKPTARVQVVAIDGDRSRRRPDRVVTEEPMEIRIHGPNEPPQSVAVTMRTPGNDFELAVGFCVSEGLLASRESLDGVEYCVSGQGEQQYNIVTIARRTAVGAEVRERNFLATASCGVCGVAALDDLVVRCPPVATGPVFAWSALRGLPSAVAGQQAVFDTTGGLHAAASFGTDGSIDLVREDVGRHNALDKLIGHAFLADGLPRSGTGVFLSGRVGFELVQKAAVAGVGCIVAVGAPTSLAIDTARALGLTIVGFMRDARANIYTGAERIDLAS
jgi:FdhD protein